MTLAQAQLSKQDSLLLTRRRSKGSDNDSLSPMIEKECAKPPQFMEQNSIVLAKKRTPTCIHKRDEGLMSSALEESRPIPSPPLPRQQSLNSLFREVSLKHGILEAELDNRVLKQPDSLRLTKRKSLTRPCENLGSSECSKPPELLKHDSIALTKKRTPNFIHSK